MVMYQGLWELASVVYNYIGTLIILRVDFVELVKGYLFELLVILSYSYYVLLNKVEIVFEARL